jgi:hypothetical protein
MSGRRSGAAPAFDVDGEDVVAVGGVVGVVCGVDFIESAAGSRFVVSSIPSARAATFVTESSNRTASGLGPTERIAPLLH